MPTENISTLDTTPTDTADVITSDNSATEASAELSGYAAFTHSWTDRWTDEEVSVSYRFRRPSPANIKRLQSTATRNPSQAARSLILDVIHPTDKAAFLRDAELYPGLVTTMSTALIKAVGLGDMGN